MADRNPVLGGAALDAGSFESSLSYREILGRRLLLNSRVRFVVGGTLLAGPWLAFLAGAMDTGSARLLSGAAIALLAFNVLFHQLGRAHVEPDASARAYDRLRLLVYAAVVVDYLALALAVGLLGGVRSPVTAFYLLHVVLGSIMLTREAAISFSVLAYVLICAQAYAEIAGWAMAPALRSEALSLPLDDYTAFAIVAVYGVLFILTDTLVISLVEWLRASERELRLKNERLDRLSQLRRDFLRVALHNLRSPVGASQMLLENLVAGLAGPVNERQNDWLLRIGRRLEGLQEMVQDLQTLGDLETEDVVGQAEPVALDEVLADVVEEYLEQGRMVGVELVVSPADGARPVRGIHRLLREAVANYVSNAIKYAPRTGEVVLRARSRYAEGRMWSRVEVTDRGPGVSPSEVGRLFEEFGRKIRRVQDANHVPSSGLGLSITRRIAEAHGGRVGMDPGRDGTTTFWMELPAADA
ncbi:MAG: hypothetical protein AMXMBFR53_28990 [Gemmatimonadota bacterium]